jgi:hypothetical protein
MVHPIVVAWLGTARRELPGEARQPNQTLLWLEYRNMPPFRGFHEHRFDALTYRE